MGASPAIFEPVWVMEAAAIAVIILGMALGGPELFPGLLIHVPPHSIGFGVVDRANPLKLLGAVPPLSVFSCAQFAAQKVT